MVCNGQSYTKMDENLGYHYFRKPPNDDTGSERRGMMVNGACWNDDSWLLIGIIEHFSFPTKHQQDDDTGFCLEMPKQSDYVRATSISHISLSSTNVTVHVHMSGDLS